MIIRKSLMKLCGSLHQLRFIPGTPAEEEAALAAEEAVIKAVITDGNYQHFHITLSSNHQQRAKNAMRLGNYDDAVKALSEAMKHAVEFDKMEEGGMEHYTCPILFGYTEDHSEDRKEDWTMAGSVKEEAEDSIFDPIRDREDFKALFA